MKRDSIARTSTRCLVALALLACAGPALAQPVASVREKAEALLARANEIFDSGNKVEGLELYGEAARMVGDAEALANIGYTFETSDPPMVPDPRSRAKQG